MKTKIPTIILSSFLSLMILYDFALHLSEMFGWSYNSWGPANLFRDGAFYWGSISYTIFWTSYWGIAAIISVILTILIIRGKYEEH